MRLQALAFAVVLFAAAGCSFEEAPREQSPSSGASKRVSLGEGRKGHETVLVRKERAAEPADPPPPDLFRLVRYPSPAGKLAAYVSHPPADGKKHPAILWIFGGFDNGIGATAWEEASPDNDQSARAFREAGIVMMYPSLRGGNDNPGYRESFYGEVDDVIAAADYLSRLEGVDPQRIYLGGHSTGGTLALLTAECTDRFRAVFAFGPVEDVRSYGEEHLVFDPRSTREGLLRSPVRWLHGIRTPTFVFEGGGLSSNYPALEALAAESRNPLVRCFEVEGLDHFSILAAFTPRVAARIVADTGPAPQFEFGGEGVKELR